MNKIGNKDFALMKKRTAFIGAVLSLLPIGLPLVVGTSAVLTSAAVMLSVPQRVNAESAEFYFKRALDKAEKGDFSGAISDYTKAIEMDPKGKVLYYNRGTVKEDLGDYYGAISDYTKAIELNPWFLQAFSRRGQAKYSLKYYQSACSDYKKAAQLGSKSTRAWLRSDGGAWCRNQNLRKKGFNFREQRF